jgi:hypothetical protein
VCLRKRNEKPETSSLWLVAQEHDRLSPATILNTSKKSQLDTWQSQKSKTVDERVVIIVHCRNNHGKKEKLRLGRSRLPPQRWTQRNEIDEQKIEAGGLDCKLNADLRRTHGHLGAWPAAGNETGQMVIGEPNQKREEESDRGQRTGLGRRVAGPPPEEKERRKLETRFSGALYELGREDQDAHVRNREETRNRSRPARRNWARNLVEP